MTYVLPKDARQAPEDAKKVFNGEIYDVYQWQQEMFDGSKATFEMLKRTPTVVIYAATGEEEIVLLDESQPHFENYLTLPSGRVEEGEDTLVAAKRELLEETGMEFAKWRLVSVEQVHTKIEHFVYIYVASDLTGQTQQKLDNGEKITVRKVPFSEYVELVKAGKIPWDNFTARQIMNGHTKLSDILSLSEVK